MTGKGSMIFAGSTPEWAADVAAHLDRFAGAGVPAIDDLWVSTSLALLIRYRLGDDRLAVRFGRLDIDPTSWGEPTDSERLASNLLHNLHAPSELEWVDDDGYRWWGDQPDSGWSALPSEGRSLTVR